MKNENCHELNYEEYNSNELFETVYYLSIGQYNLTKLNGLAKTLSGFIKDEVWRQEGACYHCMERINDTSRLIKEMEDKNQKDNTNYVYDENLTYDLNDAFDDYCYKLCEVMFNHGLKIGGFSKRLIEDIFKDGIHS